MKKIKINFSVRQILLASICAASFLLFVLLECISGGLAGKLDAQQMAKRWSDKKDVAQISCFFSVNTEITPDRLEEFYHSLEEELKKDSIVSQSENEGARLFADAYSADGRITITSQKGKVETDAIGIGGDFFLFHPVRLLSGSYFSGNDLMQDYVILNEDAAWKLFGSNDIAGQMVEIAGVAHVVSGVIRQEEGTLYEKAGLDGSMVYVSYESLSKYGTQNGINHYEVVMPNPVEQYAYHYVKDAIGAEEREVEIVENSARYSMINRIKRIKDFATRSMNGKAIIYPYWENVARAYEDLLSILMLFELFFLGVAVGIFAFAAIIYWRRKSWTVKGIALKIKEKAEDLLEKRRINKKTKKREGRRQRKWQDIKEYEED